MERNPCVASGCPGYCCENIDIEVTRCERSRLFPKAKHVGSISELAELKKSQESGIFYTEYEREGLRGDFYIVTLNGPCPNRLNDGSCAKHEERGYAARNFRIGCPDCNAIRKEHGLAPIFIEPVE